MNFEGWQLGLIDNAGYNGIRDEHIEIVAKAIIDSGVTEVDDSLFEKICLSCCIDANNFTAYDIEKLKQKLNV